MKISLQLKLGQSLSMTPQLQQAIKLLQLSTLDLQQEISQALESNPMLELIEHDDADGDSGADSEHDASEYEILKDDQGSASESGEPEYQAERQSKSDAEEQDGNQTEGDWGENIPTELSTDSQWEDTYQGSGSSGFEGESESIEARSSAEETLQDHLLWQLNLSHLSDRDKLIAEAIIDSIAPNGRLSSEIEDLVQGFDPEDEIEEDEVIAVLHRIQHFDPVGVGYRSLSECLLIQLNLLDNADPALAWAKLIIRDYIDLLGVRDYAQLMRRTRLKEAELSAAIRLIEGLNPQPGADIAPSTTTYVVPDVIVSKDLATQSWRVELNPDVAPKLRINADYAALVQRGNSSADNTYLRDNLQEARWFLKSLQSRNDTLMKVATRIVEHQIGFLEHGEEAMKPLVLHDIAEAVEMHESTISRVTTQKYMHTPRGIFELKYFFSSHVSTAGGGECSSTAIRAIIRKLVAAENTRKPLSDSKIADLLQEQGINVARRTIAKYREGLNIPPSNERKRLTAD
jgi:RNA polymerase sigma-54 factor